MMRGIGATRTNPNPTPNLHPDLNYSEGGGRKATEEGRAPESLCHVLPAPCKVTVRWSLLSPVPVSVVSSECVPGCETPGTSRIGPDPKPSPLPGLAMGIGMVISATPNPGDSSPSTPKGTWGSLSRPTTGQSSIGGAWPGRGKGPILSRVTKCVWVEVAAPGGVPKPAPVPRCPGRLPAPANPGQKTPVYSRGGSRGDPTAPRWRCGGCHTRSTPPPSITLGAEHSCPAVCQLPPTKKTWIYRSQHCPAAAPPRPPGPCSTGRMRPSGSTGGLGGAGGGRGTRGKGKKGAQGPASYCSNDTKGLGDGRCGADAEHRLHPHIRSAPNPVPIPNHPGGWRGQSQTPAKSLKSRMRCQLK